MKIEMLEQTAGEVFASAVAGCILGIRTVSDWGQHPLPNPVKQEACKPTLQPTLIGSSKWGSVRLSSPQRLLI